VAVRPPPLDLGLPGLCSLSAKTPLHTVGGVKPVTPADDAAVEITDQTPRPANPSSESITLGAMDEPTLREDEPLIAPDVVTIVSGDFEPVRRADGSVEKRYLKPGIYLPGQVIPEQDGP
jgi:hypothetical protein